MLTRAVGAAAPNPVSFDPGPKGTKGASEFPHLKRVLVLRVGAARSQAAASCMLPQLQVFGVSLLVHQIRLALRQGSVEVRSGRKAPQG